MKTLDRLDVSRAGDEIRIEASARSFLHNQVRSMVGSLKLVGEGKWTAADLKRRSTRVIAALAARWRRLTVFISPGSTTAKPSLPARLRIGLRSPRAS